MDEGEFRISQSSDQLIQLNHACNRFEQDWQNGRCSKVEDFLGDVEPQDFDRLVAALLPIEADYRRRMGSSLTLDECLSRFPRLDEPWLRELIDESKSEDTQDTKVADSNEKPSSSLERIHNYDLIEKIGEGGFGIVYRAEQRKPMRRLVALKILKPGMDSEQIMGRFEAERQALAIMDHPNIARVYDAGTTENGRPYFVMELVRGVPITEYCDQCKLSFRERLQLFITVCQAVQHAHQKGVIHRDLKPTNVLVSVPDGSPVVKVIDFGVAKAINRRLTERTLRTAHAQMLGTPLYMSPEQAEMSVLDVDTRSDIYALGILLYELLTGTTPIEKTRLESASFDEVRRLIREDEPLLPSARLSTIAAANMETIADRRRTDPRRYAQLVQGDLDWIVMKSLEKDRTRRYPSASALAADVTRHLQDMPIEACAPSWSYQLGKFAKRHRRMLETIAVVLSLMLVAASIVFWQATKVSRAQQQREDAEKQTRAVAQFLVETFRSPDPTVDGRKITVAELLDRAVADLPTKFPDSSANKANMLQAIGETFMGLGLPNKAVEVLRQSKDMHHELFGGHNAKTIQIEELLAQAYQEAGNDTLAIEVAEGVVAKQEDDRVIREIGDILAGAYARTDRYDESVQLLKDIYIARRESLGPQNAETLMAMSELGRQLLHVGRTAEARELLEETVRIQKDELTEDHPQTMQSEFQLALAYFGEGARQKSIALQRDLLKRFRENLGPHHSSTNQSMHSLAYCLGQMNRISEAIAIYKELLDGKTSRSRRSIVRSNLAVLYMQSNKLDLAMGVWKDIVDSAGENEIGERYHLTALFNLASALGKQREWDAAASHYEQLLALEGDLTYDRASQALNRLGTIYATQGDVDALQSYGERILPRVKRPLDNVTTERLVLPFLVADKSNAASPTMETILAIAKESTGHGLARVARGIAYLRSGDFMEAQSRLKRSLYSDSVFCRHLAATYLAIAEHQLGNSEAANAALNEAAVLSVRVRGRDDVPSNNWHLDLLSLQATEQAKRELQQATSSSSLFSQ